MNGPQPSSNAPALPRFGEIAADAMRYWEPRRILYNLVLTGVVLAHFITAWPASRSLLAWDTLFQLIFLAVLANVCYCAAVGIIFAAVIAHFFSTGLFSHVGAD